MRNKIVTILGAALVAAIVFAAPASADAQSRTLVTRVVVMEFPQYPAPSSTRASGLFTYARDYWDRVSDDALSLRADGPVVAASTDSTDPYGRDFTNDFPSDPDVDVYLIVSNHPNNGFSYSVRGNPGYVFISATGTTKTAAHEFGHVWNLGHSHALLRLGSEDFWADYGNQWSIQGSGTGAPDVAQLAHLGLATQETLGSKPRTLRMTPVGLPGRDSVCWTSKTSPARYCAEYRRSVGLDSDVDLPAGVMVYRSDYDGYHTFQYDFLRAGKKHLYGGVWVHARSTGTTALVTLTPRTTL